MPAPEPASSAFDESRGILDVPAARRHFDFTRRAPAPGLAPFVEHYWIVKWDLDEPYEQRVLPNPVVNMTFKTGRCRVSGVLRRTFVERLDGAHRVFGVGFRPGGFHPFLDRPVSSLADRFVPVPALFGTAGAALCEAVLAADDTTAASLVDGFLLSFAPVLDGGASEARAAVELIATDPSVLQVGELAARLGTGVRRLQRLFTTYVGVGPKWAIRRARMQEAAVRAGSGAPVRWAAMAAELGYADQAHFTRDFTATVGESPARYAARVTG